MPALVVTDKDTSLLANSDEPLHVGAIIGATAEGLWSIPDAVDE